MYLTSNMTYAYGSNISETMETSEDFAHRKKEVVH